MTDRHEISNGTLSAAVKADGAELCSLRAGGRELLWQAGPEWPRHAPVLFPVIGKLAGGVLRHGGRTYEMGQHGFARDRRFAWAEQGPAECRLVLADDDATRAMYPFPFRFEAAYALHGASLTATFSVTNTGEGILPASCGAHPAFRWPLADGVRKEAHTLTFEQAETAPIRRPRDGFLGAERFPSPVQGRVLPLHEGLFAEGAIILERPASRRVRFTATSAPVIEVAWQGFEQLGIWMPPGADFLCIEPWYGHTDPEGFSGEFVTKPGLMLLEPGETRSFTHRVTIEG
jgi:galactose mutarotase-like enzyme